MVQQFQRQSGLSRAQLTGSGLAVASPGQPLGSPLLSRRTGRASNGTLATATVLGNLPAPRKRINDSVGQGNSKDFFQVTVTESSRIRFAVSNRSEATLTIAILDANGKVVTSRGQQQLVRVGAGTQAESVFRGAQPGVYYLRVSGPNQGSQRYQVNLFSNSNLGPQPLPCGCGL